MRVCVVAFQVTIVECGELKQETKNNMAAVEDL